MFVDPDGLLEVLSDELNLFVATVYGEAASSSPEAKRAVANVIVNRVGKREWSILKTVSDVIKFSHFDAYKNPNVPCKEATEYLKNRDGTNASIEETIYIVSSVLIKKLPIIQTVLYFIIVLKLKKLFILSFLSYILRRQGGILVYWLK